MKIYYPEGMGRFSRPFEIVEVVKDPGFTTTDMALKNAGGRIVCVAKDGPFRECDEDLETGSIFVSADSVETPLGEQIDGGTEEADANQPSTDDDVVVDSVNGDDED